MHKRSVPKSKDCIDHGREIFKLSTKSTALVANFEESLCGVIAELLTNKQNGGKQISSHRVSFFAKFVGFRCIIK